MPFGNAAGPPAGNPSPGETRDVPRPPGVDGGAPGDGPGRFGEQSGKLLRIATMSRELLGEIRNTRLDDSGRRSLQSAYERTVVELRALVPEELQKELDNVLISFDEAATEPELRLAQAQLVGWLEGLFQGIQAAMLTQRMQAMQGMQGSPGGRRVLPPGEAPEPDVRGLGQYL